jgi:hypothetical protein
MPRFPLRTIEESDGFIRDIQKIGKFGTVRIDRVESSHLPPDRSDSSPIGPVNVESSPPPSDRMEASTPALNRPQENQGSSHSAAEREESSSQPVKPEESSHPPSASSLAGTYRILMKGINHIKLYVCHLSGLLEVHILLFVYHLNVRRVSKDVWRKKV